MERIGTVDTINVIFGEVEKDGKLPLFVATPCLRQPTHLAINGEVYELRKERLDPAERWGKG